jgi:hypothetical protein
MTNQTLKAGDTVPGTNFILPPDATYLGTGEIQDDGSVTNVPSGWQVDETIVGKNSAHPVTKTTAGKTRHVRPLAKKIASICGHMVDTTCFPSANCAGCWNAFLYSNLEMTKTNITVLKEGGRRDIQHVHGSKYVKQLLRFCADVLKAIEKNKEKIDE